MKTIKYHLIILSVLLSAVPLFARTPLVTQEEVLVGTRPLGMAGAFVAAADDSSSISWNPAGMAFMKQKEISFSMPLNPLWARDLKIGINNFYAAFLFPVNKTYTLGIDWFHIGYSDDPDLNWNKKPELEYSENKITLAMARKFGEKLKIGASLKYYNLGVNYDGSTERTGNGIGMDIGANYRALDIMKVGLLANNIFGAHLFYDNGTSSRFMSPALKLGFAFNLIKDNTLELTADDMLHLGIEHWFFNMVALRGGVQKEILNSGEDFGLSAGLGVKYRYFQVDYALQYRKYFDMSHSVSLAAKFGYHAYLVDVLSIQIEDVFTAMYKAYAQRDIVRLKVKNKSSVPLKAKIGFMLDKYMDSPTEKDITLKPNVPVDLTLPVVFNNKIMNVKDDGPQNGRIIVTYEFEKEKSEDDSSKQFMLYSRNAFIWDDLEKLAVFVTPSDEMVKSFTRGMIQLNAKQDIQDEFVSDNYYYTMLLFNALGEFGMTYVVDPSTPFAEVAKNRNAVDYVSYPAETLHSKTGDCDDLTVLFCSCLENIGIPTAFIDVPGHIFMLFSLNMTTDKAQKFFGSDEYFVDMNGQAWMPLETTMFGKPFTEALKEARQELQKWSGQVDSGSIDKNSVRIVFVESAWKKYPSAQLNELWAFRFPDINKVAQKNREDSVKLMETVNREYQMAKEKLDQYPDVPNFNNDMGILCSYAGLYTVAFDHFQKAIKLKPNWDSAYNNMANVYLLNNKLDKAVNYYKKALEIKPGDNDITQNLKKAQQLLKEEF
ncbi:MAG: PorV/PorQ family protein [bacterium]|nr:PorV/PorQ family protein [bacterium]